MCIYMQNRVLLTKKPAAKKFKQDTQNSKEKIAEQPYRHMRIYITMHKHILSPFLDSYTHTHTEGSHSKLASVAYMHGCMCLWTGFSIALMHYHGHPPLCSHMHVHPHNEQSRISKLLSRAAVNYYSRTHRTRNIPSRSSPVRLLYTLVTICHAGGPRGNKDSTISARISMFAGKKT